MNPSSSSDAAFVSNYNKLRAYVRGRGVASATRVVNDCYVSMRESDSCPAAFEEVVRWVFGIARHEVQDEFRRKGRAPGPLPDALSSSSTSPESPLVADEAIRIIGEMIGSLSERDQQLFATLGERGALVADQLGFPVDLLANLRRTLRNRCRRWLLAKYPQYADALLETASTTV